MSRILPRLVIAALRGGAGKTALTMALAVAFSRRGIPVVPFKKGPDYIDAAWLSRAASSTCFNLDTYLMGSDKVRGSFSRRAQENTLALIEGNRGLYDGMNLAGEHSTAELAKLLFAPVIIVVDCDKTTRTAAAMVLGCQTLDPEVKIKGVILNRTGTARHGETARRSIEAICRLPVFGVVPRGGDLSLPERHLGLIPPEEHHRVRDVLDMMGDLAQRHLDVAGLISAAEDAPPWSCDGPEPLPRIEAGDNPVNIGIIRDRAFHFYYPENIEGLVAAGARIVEISAADDECLPEIDGLYIGGGFPETSAEILAGNSGFRRSLGSAIERGLPVYAECGGFIYLGKYLTIEEKKYPMAGVLPVSFKLKKRPQGHGYTLLRVIKKNPFFPLGIMVRGHEFHYCQVDPPLEDEGGLVFQVKRGEGIDGARDGMVYKNTLATFTHLHALGEPLWVSGLINQARRFRMTSNGICRS